MALAMLKLTKIMESFSAEADRRTLAYEVWRTYGGPLTGTERSRLSRERTATIPLLDATIPQRNGNGDGTIGSPLTLPSTARSSFQVPGSVLEALGKSKILGSNTRLRSAEFWQAQVRANPGVNYAAEVLKAEAWMAANPERAPRKNFARFMHTWLGRATDHAE